MTQYTKQLASVGRIVHFMLTSAQALKINDLRRTYASLLSGTRVSAGDVFPMIITRVHDDPPRLDSVVSGQVFLDGNDHIWVSAAQEGSEPGQWCWPPHVPPKLEDFRRDHEQQTNADPAKVEPLQWTPEELAKIKAAKTVDDLHKVVANKLDPSVKLDDLGPQHDFSPYAAGRDDCSKCMYPRERHPDQKVIDKAQESAAVCPGFKKGDRDQSRDEYKCSTCGMLESDHMPSRDHTLTNSELDKAS